MFFRRRFAAMTMGALIVDIPEGSKDQIAHSVKVGAPGAAVHADHDAH